MNVSPYLHYNGRCEEAIEHYKNAIGAKVEMLMRFKQAPDSHMVAPGSEEKIMHAHLKIGDSHLLVSDGRGEGETRFDGFSLSVTVNSEAEAEKIFTAIGEGGQILMPLAKTFFSPKFGMTSDKFGVMWMIYVMPG